jgi:hypothetical protein
MFTPVTPPRLDPPRVSLVTSARNPLADGDETEGKWVNGFSFRPELNQDPTLRTVCSQTQDVPGSQPTGARVDTVPWTVDVHDTCSVMGYGGVDYIGRAIRALDAATPKGVEREFWKGTLATAEGWPNLHLASAGAVDLTPTPGTAVSLREAFELLEDAIAVTGAGGRGMIHVAAWSTPSYDLIRREGLMLLTARDTIVVSGSGYPGTGPNGADPSAAGHTWVYATGVVDVRLGDIEVFGRVDGSGQGNWMTVTPAGDGGQIGLDGFDINRFVPALVNRATNDLTVLARRPVAATWDGACHAAVLVTLDPGDV